MNLNTRRKLLQLNHKNILTVDKIKREHFMTTLISKAFDGHGCPLSNIKFDIGIDQLFSYLEQITLALLQLHNHNIVHCDLRCDHIYINQAKGTVKISHFGRSVSLEGRTYAFKMMPTEAEKWSAPEVRVNKMYSKSSDIFSLAVVFWEAICTQQDVVNSFYPLPKFHQCKTNMEAYADINITDNRTDDITKILKCMKQCWNPNQTKRPTAEVILNRIQQIRRDILSYWSTDRERKFGTEETGHEVVYESIIEKPVLISQSSTVEEKL
ncbi:probable serine/threonine-protein kinase DDB_G0278535 [Pyxicephalus adspersus]|uniref:probable serine/threonine-protein kinase DDB_G0278535 n=1 Tax=Pyxicephalus adspersus TaxID=30357 RepID=UPI003B5B5C3B